LVEVPSLKSYFCSARATARMRASSFEIFI
jgi:hypothetical protein